jgi:hypothetical protein
VNEIAFVIAPYEYGLGPAEGVEPVIDGVSLVDLFERVDGRSSYAGLVCHDRYLEHWRRILASGGDPHMKLLGCGCGDPDCSYTTARVEVAGDTVVWSDFWGTSRARGSQSGRYEEIGPFRFDRGQYAAALTTPVRAEAPIRGGNA